MILKTITSNFIPLPRKKIFLRDIVFVFSMLLIHDVSAQSLLDVYKKGIVKLTPDIGYAQDNPWDKIFETRYDNPYIIQDKPLSIIMMPSGSVVVNIDRRNYYLLFDENGKFVKEFGITDIPKKEFRKVHPTNFHPMITGVINNTLFFGINDWGQMVCFDFNGNYVKTLDLKYRANKYRGMIPMIDNKIAMVGVTWKRDKNRNCDFVAIVDYQTGEQKIIWEHYTDKLKQGNHELFSYSYTSKKGGYISTTTMPFISYFGLSLPPQISFVNDMLSVALPHSGEILTYNVNGKLLSKGSIEWGKKYLSVEEQMEIQKRAIERYSKDRVPPSGSKWASHEEEYAKAMESMAKQMKEDLNKITTPIPIPVFSNIIKDSDGNLLFFEMLEKDDADRFYFKGANKFNVWVYQNGGKFVCQSSFECDDYDLFIAPSKMVFHNGYIYALQTLKNANGNPLRLVRFKVGN